MARESLGVIAHRLSQATGLGVEVEVELRTRPVRRVTGLVTQRRIAPGRRAQAAVRRGQKPPERSNLLVTIGGEEYEVERMAAVRRADGVGW